MRQSNSLSSNWLDDLVVDAEVKLRQLPRAFTSSSCATTKNSRRVIITSKQTFEREGKYLTHRASRYGHTRQHRRMRSVINRQGTIVGRLSWEIVRKANALSTTLQEALMQSLVRANRIQESPFDGHTLIEQIEQATILIQDVAVIPETVYVDRDYRLKKAVRLPIRTLLADRKRQMTEEERRKEPT